MAKTDREKRKLAHGRLYGGTAPDDWEPHSKVEQLAMIVEDLIEKIEILEKKIKDK